MLTKPAAIERGRVDASLREHEVRSRACRGLRRGFFSRPAPLRPLFAQARWTLRDYLVEAREAVGLNPKPERWARVFAKDVAQALQWERRERRLVLPVADIDLVVVALQHFAGRRARRVRAVALACVFAAFVGMSARDNNANQRADILDLAVAAREIIGFGPGAGEMARRTGAPRAAPIMKSEGK